MNYKTQDEAITIKTNSFKFLIKLCLKSVIFWILTLLAIIIIFIASFQIKQLWCIANTDSTEAGGLAAGFSFYLMIIIIIISSLLIFIGAIVGTRKIKKGFLKSLLFLFFPVVVTVPFLILFLYILHIPEIEMKTCPGVYNGNEYVKTDGFHIYFYPEQEQDIELTFRRTWGLTVYPNGHIINHTDSDEGSFFPTQNTYAQNLHFSPYIIYYDFTKGFVVRGGGKTKIFLEETLSEIGLTGEEIDDFIDHWYPKMENNTYNLIHFGRIPRNKDRYVAIEPEPDTINQVFVVWAPLSRKIIVEPQIIESFQARDGFTIVEMIGFQGEFQDRTAAY